MKLVDIVITLNKRNVIMSIDWKNEQLERIYKSTWDTYINKNLENISDIKINKNIEDLHWKDEAFMYEELKISYKI